MEPAFSVIVPVYHSGELLAKTLAALREQELPSERFEVLVAGRADEVVAAQITEAAAADGRCTIRYLPVESSRRARLMNAACAAARGEILAITDDDCVPPTDWLRKLGDAFEGDPDAGIVGGPDRFIHRRGGFSLAHDWVLNSFLGTGGCRRAGGWRVGAHYPRLYNMAVPRRLALELAFKGKDGQPQVFDERLPVHENVDLARRVEAHGKRLVHLPNLVVEHYRGSTFGAFVGRNFLMGRASRVLGTHRMAHRVLSAALLGVATLGVLAAFWAPARAALVACLGAYVLILLLSGLAAAWQTGRLAALAAAPLLLAGVHLARAAGYLLPGRPASEKRP